MTRKLQLLQNQLDESEEAHKKTKYSDSYFICTSIQFVY